jgi:hypothetical protein
VEIWPSFACCPAAFRSPAPGTAGAGKPSQLVDYLSWQDRAAHASRPTRHSALLILLPALAVTLTTRAAGPAAAAPAAASQQIVYVVDVDAQARERGRAKARLELLAGRPIHLMHFGLMPPPAGTLAEQRAIERRNRLRAEVLRERGVVDEGGGCIVTPEDNGYVEEMQAALSRRFGDETRFWAAVDAEVERRMTAKKGAPVTGGALSR